jgi:signal transduction histidine kinase
MPENSASGDPAFAHVVSLACHDLRTPLATAFGFARTLSGVGLPEPAARYVAMIEAASEQMASLLDDLGLVARIEGGRYEPVLQERDTAELAHAAAARAGSPVTAAGEGSPVAVDAEPLERSLAAFAVAAVRHGGVDSVSIVAAERTVRIGPVTAAAAPVLLADELKDLGSAVALRLLATAGAGVGLEGSELVIRL